MDDYFGLARELLAKGRAQIADPYAQAELYDLLNLQVGGDEFYVEFAKERGGRVLDLACGSGRLLPQLLDAGLARWNWFWGICAGFPSGSPLTPSSSPTVP